MARRGKHWRIRAQRGGETVELEGDGVMDEVVVDHWLHVEQMEKRAWWVRIGDARIQVTLGGGKVTVDVRRGDYGPVVGKTSVPKASSRRASRSDRARRSPASRSPRDSS